MTLQSRIKYLAAGIYRRFLLNIVTKIFPLYLGIYFTEAENNSKVLKIIPHSINNDIVETSRFE